MSLDNLWLIGSPQTCGCHQPLIQVPLVCFSKQVQFSALSGKRWLRAPLWLYRDSIWSMRLRKWLISSASKLACSSVSPSRGIFSWTRLRSVCVLSTSCGTNWLRWVNIRSNRYMSSWLRGMDMSLLPKKETQLCLTWHLLLWITRPFISVCSIRFTRFLSWCFSFSPKTTMSSAMETTPVRPFRCWCILLWNISCNTFSPNVCDANSLVWLCHDTIYIYGFSHFSSPTIAGPDYVKCSIRSAAWLDISCRFFQGSVSPRRCMQWVWHQRIWEGCLCRPCCHTFVDMFLVGEYCRKLLGLSSVEAYNHLLWVRVVARWAQ